ncbi:hypothetical protein [Gemmatimonas phototrophica]|uniref:Lipoprotein n=1 Tax=Gemmatimonas phototrophica TaxID=1379270 RepID=A0A143BND0_9BACT|nr:hypothetical protein [Gemmatimonas phototrophica]AMW06133.1 hypothetical protein GEMMAAP_17760 [Gemmatimonas phototrophica]
MRASNRAPRVLVLAGITLLTACTPRRSPTDASGQPLLVMRVLQDVPVQRLSLGLQRRGVLYGDTALVIRKGERFDMVAQTQEGGCRIRYAARVIELASCPWLPGFSDPERDFYEIVSRMPRIQTRTPFDGQDR